MRLAVIFQYIFVVSGTIKKSPNMDLFTNYLLPEILQKIWESQIVFRRILFFISQHFKIRNLKLMKSAGRTLLEYDFLMGPKQLLSPNFLNKNKRAEWWNLDNSLRAQNLQNMSKSHRSGANIFLKTCWLCLNNWWWVVESWYFWTIESSRLLRNIMVHLQNTDSHFNFM